MAKLTQRPLGQRIVKRATANEFWAVADYFRRASADWTPANAGYELWRTVDADGQSWSVCMKLHIVPGPPERKGVLHFKASITLWPPSLSRQKEKRLAKLGWYHATKQTLAGAGYSGKWSKSPLGTWGDFWKDLPSAAAVRREASMLQKLRLSRPGAS